MSRKDRYRGCLIGLAVGDAVGTAVEFQPPGSFTPVDDMLGGGTFGLNPGQWTDDTSMALCLAESLVECGGFDARDQMARYCRWWRTGYLSSTGHCFDIGNATRAALERFEQTGQPLAGSTDPHTAGNGSIMRLAPIPMYYAADSLAAVDHAAESSRTTHAAPAAVDACRLMASIVAGALKGLPKSTLLAPEHPEIPGFWDRHALAPEIDDIRCGKYKRLEPPAIRGSGWVVATLEAALWAFDRTDSYREGLLKVVNLGEDADTTGAVYGQIAGAYYGEQAIPSSWRQRLYYGERIGELAEQLLSCAFREGD
ncbi:MAG: ADP-ribosylglycohydrolase family protein [Planctomycetota bacterium]|nr:MAG: ADP-ribosylglycohydrolase family protein [Planctomycetota bacterium]